MDLVTRSSTAPEVPLSLDMVLGYAVAPISLVLCGALAQVHTALMFGGTAVILAVTAVGVLASPRVRASR